MAAINNDTLEAMADFNELTESGLLLVARANVRSSRSPGAGESLYVRDPEGNRCWGRCVRITPDVVYVRLDASTWLHGDIESKPAHEYVPLDFKDRQGTKGHAQSLQPA